MNLKEACLQGKREIPFEGIAYVEDDDNPEEKEWIIFTTYNPELKFFEFISEEGYLVVVHGTEEQFKQTFDFMEITNIVPEEYKAIVEKIINVEVVDFYEYAHQDLLKSGFHNERLN